MNRENIKGIIVPILTPIDSDERISEEKLRKQVEFVISGGVDGILAFGSNGEFYMIEEAEMERGLMIILDQVSDRIPVYMGVGAIATSKCIRLSQMGRSGGAAGISVLQPMFLKPNEEEMFEHFCSIADSIKDTPMLLYNNPGRAGYTIKAPLVEKLARSKENIAGIKDSSGDLTQTMDIIDRTRDLDFRVFGGKDTLIFASLAHGAVGAVATTANFVPEHVSSIYRQFVAGNLDASLKEQYSLFKVRMAMDEASFPVATKDFANLVGLDVGIPYKPNKPSNNDILCRFRKIMQQVQYID